METMKLLFFRLLFPLCKYVKNKLLIVEIKLSIFIYSSEDEQIVNSALLNLRFAQSSLYLVHFSQDSFTVVV